MESMITHGFNCFCCGVNDCNGYFRVYSSATQWSEWFVTVPMLQYVALAGEPKASMSAFDLVLLSLLALMIFFGFALNLPGLTVGAAVFLLLLSASCLFVVTVLSFRYNSIVSASFVTTKPRMGSNNLSARMTLRKGKLLVELVIILWYYPLMYLLALCQQLDVDYKLTLDTLGSMLGKTVFASLVVESQVSMLYQYLVSTSGAVDARRKCDDRSVSTSTRPSAFFRLGRGSSHEAKVVPVEASCAIAEAVETGAAARISSTSSAAPAATAATAATTAAATAPNAAGSAAGSAAD